MKNTSLLVALLCFVFTTFAHDGLKQRPAPNNYWAATPLNFEGKFPVDVVLDNPCTGEPVHFTGTEHFELHGMLNDNRVTTITHFNAQGVKGTGLSSGTSYNFIDSYNYSSVMGVLVDGQSNLTEIQSNKIVAAGKSNNLVFKSMVHITINANGTVTAFLGDYSLECQ